MEDSEEEKLRMVRAALFQYCSFTHCRQELHNIWSLFIGSLLFFSSPASFAKITAGYSTT